MCHCNRSIRTPCCGTSECLRLCKSRHPEKEACRYCAYYVTKNKCSRCNSTNIGLTRDGGKYLKCFSCGFLEATGRPGF